MLTKKFEEHEIRVYCRKNDLLEEAKWLVNALILQILRSCQVGSVA